MIRVQVMLEPGGDKSLTRVLTEIVITNITRDGGRVSSDYAWRIRSIDRNKTETFFYGALVDSYNSTAVDLLWEVLDEWKSGRPHPIDNHGQPRPLIKDHEAFWKLAEPEDAMRDNPPILGDNI
jgi:hypothetical protein